MDNNNQNSNSNNSIPLGSTPPTGTPAPTWPPQPAANPTPPAPEPAPPATPTPTWQSPPPETPPLPTPPPTDSSAAPFWGSNTASMPAEIPPQPAGMEQPITIASMPPLSEQPAVPASPPPAPSMPTQPPTLGMDPNMPLTPPAPLDLNSGMPPTDPMTTAANIPGFASAVAPETPAGPALGSDLNAASLGGTTPESTMPPLNAPQTPTGIPTFNTEPSEPAPTDLSGLTGSPEQPPPPDIYVPPVNTADNLVGSATPTPGTTQAAANGNAKLPDQPHPTGGKSKIIWLVLGLVLILAVVGASYYFIFLQGASSTPTSVPAEQSTLTNPPVSIVETPVPTPTQEPATSSATESSVDSTGGTRSALDLARDRQSTDTTPTPTPESSIPPRPGF